VTWPDGRVFAVQQHRCLGCGALDLVERDVRESEKDHKPVTGKYAPSDGRRMTVDERR
jgi:hypothetical protein